MRRYRVAFTFGAILEVEAENKREAKERVEQMTDEELWEYVHDGFEIQGVEEVEE